MGFRFELRQIRIQDWGASGSGFKGIEHRDSGTKARGIGCSAHVALNRDACVWQIVPR